MLRRIFCIIISLIFAGAGNYAYAGAGWYPTTPGDIIEISVCLPSKHGKVIYLQGSGTLNGFKTFQKFKPRMTKDFNYCPKSQREFTYPWKVNIKGGWGLSFFDPTYNKRYYGWPDGIESQ